MNNPINLDDFRLAELLEKHPEAFKPSPTDEELRLEAFMEYERTDDDLLH